MKTKGSRAEVMHGKAKKTSGGLLKRNLKYNKHGKIVSRKASKAAKKSKNLIKAGYITQKGKFGSFKKGGMTPNELRKEKSLLYSVNRAKTKFTPVEEVSKNISEIRLTTTKDVKSDGLVQFPNIFHNFDYVENNSNVSATNVNSNGIIKKCY